jgi:hypothetical protein
MHRAPVPQEVIARVDEWDHIKLKSFCTGGNNHQSEETAPGCEETFSGYSSSRGLISRIHEELKN